MNCHLLIPGLRPPPLWIDAGLLRDFHSPALQALLARSTPTPLLDEGKDAWLCRSFGVKKLHDWPVAALTLLAHGGNPGQGFWLLAEPVHLQLQRERMTLMGADNLDISPTEAHSLTEALNSHFANNRMTFFPTLPGCWHLRLDEPAQLETHPLEKVIGRNVRNFLPGGSDGKNWHRLLNEIQMLLHSHPVNENREQRGALPVNSVWPWGSGVLPENLAAPYVGVWADDALACGLAIVAGIPGANAPETAAEFLQTARPGTHLVVLDALHSAALYGDVPRWHEGLMRLEKDWFEPLRKALARGRISQLSLHVTGDTGTQIFVVSRGDLWKLWRRSKSLHQFFGAPTS